MKKIEVQSLKGYIFALFAAVLTYLFYSLVINNDEKFFTLPLEVTYSPLYVNSSPLTASVNVSVRGNPTVLARISRDNMRALVDLSSITEEGNVRTSIEIRRSGVFAQIDNVEVLVTPSYVDVVLEDRITKAISIEPAFINSLPRGYLFRSSLLTPELVDVSGPTSVVSSIDSISTDQIDLSQLTRSVYRNVLLNAPDYVRFENLTDDSVRVFININPIIEVETFRNIVISVNNSSGNVAIVDELPLIDVVLRGEQLLLERVVPEVFIDISPIQRRGTFDIDIQSSFPDGVELISIVPERVEVRVEKSEVVTEDAPDISIQQLIRDDSPELEPNRIPNSAPEETPTEVPINVPLEFPTSP